MTFEQKRRECQREYDNQLPEEIEPEKDLDDLLDELCSERHDIFLIDVIEKELKMIKAASKFYFGGMNYNKERMQHYLPNSDLYKVHRRRASQNRHSLYETLDGLTKLLSDDEKGELKKYIEELI